MQNYLRVIHNLQGQDGRASTTALARALGVTAASATGMITKLAERGLVVRGLAPYKLANALRISIGEADANRRVVEALDAFKAQAA